MLVFLKSYVKGIGEQFKGLKDKLLDPKKE